MYSINYLRCALVRENRSPYTPVSCADDAETIFRSIGMGDSAEELVAIICLSTDGSVSGVHVVGHGGLNACIIRPRDIYKRAMLNNAASIIIGHCHPSGSTKPSGEDRDVTKRLIDAGELLGIALLDHLIVAGEQCLSMRSEGYFK